MFAIAGGIILAIIVLRFWPQLLLVALGLIALAGIASVWSDVEPFIVVGFFATVIVMARLTIEERRAKRARNG